MKQKLNQIKLLLFSFIAIAFLSCEKDLYEDAISNDKTIIREIKFNELYKEQKFKNLLEKVSNNKTASKNFFEDNEDFILSDQNVKVIETDSITSYTILIKRKNIKDDSYFENLVIQKDIFNNESACIIKYVPDEIRTDVPHNSFSFTGKIIKSKYQIKSSNKSSFSRDAQSGCSIEVLMCYESWSGGAGHSHTATSDCKNIQYLYVRTVEVLCADGGSSGGGDTPPSSGSPLPPPDMGGGGGGSGDSPDDGYPPGDNPNPQPNPSQHGLVDADGNILTSPVMPDPIIGDPCGKLSKLTNTIATKNALQSLKSDTNLSSEKGFSVTKNSGSDQYNNPTPAQADLKKPNEIVMPVGGNNIGSFHTHPTDQDGWFPMFSDGDLNYLFFVASRHNNDGNPKDYSEYFLTLTVPEGTFAIKIKNWAEFAINRNNRTHWNSRGELQISRKKYDKRKATDNIEVFKKDLLEILKKLNMGVGLYEANADLSSWSEVVLDPIDPKNNPTNNNPCN